MKEVGDRTLFAGINLACGGTANMGELLEVSGGRLLSANRGSVRLMHQGGCNTNLGSCLFNRKRNDTCSFTPDINKKKVNNDERRDNTACNIPRSRNLLSFFLISFESFGYCRLALHFPGHLLAFPNFGDYG